MESLIRYFPKPGLFGAFSVLSEWETLLGIQLEKTVVSQETNQNQTATLLTPQVGPRTCQRRVRSVRKGARQESRKSVPKPDRELFSLHFRSASSSRLSCTATRLHTNLARELRFRGAVVTSREPVDSRRPPDWQDVFPGVVSPAAT